MNKRIVVALALCAMLVGLSSLFIDGSRAAAPSGKVTAQSKAKRTVVPGRVIVKYRDDAAAADAEAFIGAHLQVRNLSVPRLQVIDIPFDIDAGDYAQLLKQMPGVEFAEPDYLIFPAGLTPNDPLYTSEWHLATINDQAEQDWLTQTFGPIGGAKWIGLNRRPSDGAACRWPVPTPGWGEILCPRPVVRGSRSPTLSSRPD